MKKYIGYSAALGVLFTPLLAFGLNFRTYLAAYDSLRILLNWAFGVLLAIAVFAVAYGIFKFVINSGNEQGRKEGRSTILWGVIGIFLMVSLWGLVNLLSSIIELNTQAPTISNSILPTITGLGVTGPGTGTGGGI